GDRGVRRAAGELILRLDQQPRVGFFTTLRPNADQVPTTLQTMACQHKFQMTFLQGLARVPDRLPWTLVPHDHCAGTVLAARNIAFEIQIIDRVILGLNGEPFLTDHEAWPTRD